MVFVAPLDLQYWFITVFAGSSMIFFALAFIGIAALAAYFRMPNMIAMIMMALFAIFMYVYTGELLIISVVIIGLITFWGLARLFK